MTVFAIKIIACISMLTDHVGVVLYPGNVYFRYVGRLAFPIYCFLLTEGYYRTGNVRKYLIRLAAFAVISEIPFDLAMHEQWFYPEKQNVYFTLFLGLLMLYLLEWTDDVILKVFVCTSIMIAAEAIQCDYRYPGIWMILSFAVFREFPVFRDLNVMGVNIRLFASKVQDAGSLALIPIALYNGKKGPSWKWFFYSFYPVHLLSLYLIKVYLW